jgi:hypothetical protein
MIYLMYVNTALSSATSDISQFEGYLLQRTDATIASVLRVDDIHRSHLIAGHRRVQAHPVLRGTTVVLDTGIKLGSHINDGVLPKVTVGNSMRNGSCRLKPL